MAFTVAKLDGNTAHIDKGKDRPGIECGSMEECHVSLFTCRNNYFKDKNMVSVHGPLEGVGIELLCPKRIIIKLH